MHPKPIINKVLHTYRDNDVHYKEKAMWIQENCLSKKYNTLIDNILENNQVGNFKIQITANEMLVILWFFKGFVSLNFTGYIY
jgi:hypothetical protein